MREQNHSLNRHEAYLPSTITYLSTHLHLLPEATSYSSRLQLNPPPKQCFQPVSNDSAKQPNYSQLLCQSKGDDQQRQPLRIKRSAANNPLNAFDALERATAHAALSRPVERLPAPLESSWQRARQYFKATREQEKSIYRGRGRAGKGGRRLMEMPLNWDLTDTHMKNGPEFYSHVVKKCNLQVYITPSLK